MTEEMEKYNSDSLVSVDINYSIELESKSSITNPDEKEDITPWCCFGICSKKKTKRQKSTPLSVLRRDFDRSENISVIATSEKLSPTPSDTIYRINMNDKDDISYSQSIDSNNGFNSLIESTIDAESVSVNNLSNSPVILQDEITKNIKLFEHSIRDYSELEKEALQSSDPVLKDAVHAIRNDPSAFSNSAIGTIKILADKRSAIIDQAQTIIFDEDFKRSSRRLSLNASLDLTKPSYNKASRRVSMPGPGLAKENLNLLRDDKYLNEMKLLEDQRNRRNGHDNDETTNPMQQEREEEQTNSDTLSIPFDEILRNRHTKLAFETNDAAIQENLSSKNDSTSRPTSESNASIVNSRSQSHNSLTHDMSVVWAGRLAEVTPTQGVLSQDHGVPGSIVTYKIRPKWPEWLVDTSFEVIKTNKYGKRQKRLLTLTEFHIWNIKDNVIITRAHAYAEVNHCYLMNDRCFVIEIGNTGETHYYYETFMASHIVQQIATRVQVRRALDIATHKVEEDLQHNSHTATITSSPRMGYSVKATEALIDRIVIANSSENASSIVSFAQILGERAARNSSEVIRKPTIRSDSDSSSRNSVQLLRRLVSILPDSVEYKLLVELQSRINSVSTPEGNTTQHFIRNFPPIPSDDDLVQFRHFVDGMQEYMLETKMKDYAELLKDSNNSSVDSFDVTYGANDITEDMVTAVSYLTFNVVEETLFFALEDKILNHFLISDERKKYERMLVRKMAVLSSKSQADWGIPESYISNNGWRSAVFEMAGVERNPTPSMRLNALVRSAKSIYAEFNADTLLKQELNSEGQSSSATVLGADDFLPIFIYVLCQSELKHPSLNRDILWKLCHPDQLHGESGYYLTAYESALTYLETVSVDEDQLNNIDVIETDSDFLSKKGQLNPSAPPTIRARLATKIRRLSVSVMSSPSGRKNSLNYNENG